MASELSRPDSFATRALKDKQSTESLPTFVEDVDVPGGSQMFWRIE
jgi:hypothetical protein